MQNQNKQEFLFGRNNYVVMIAGIAVILLGFLLMSIDKEKYGFGTMGLTVGPIVVLIGFTIEFFAIFMKKKEKE